MDASLIVQQALHAFATDISYTIAITESVPVPQPPSKRAARQKERPVPDRSRLEPRRLPTPPPVFPVTVRYTEPTAAPRAPDPTPEEWLAIREHNEQERKRKKAEWTEAQLEERRARDRARYWAQKAEVGPRARVSRSAGRTAEQKARIAEQQRERWASRTPEEREADRVYAAERQRIRRARLRGESSS